MTHESASSPIHSIAAGLEGNLRILPRMRIINYAWIYIPTLVAFYQSVGLTLGDVLLLKSIHSLVIIACEMPTGFIADRWGRKPCLCGGGLVWLASLAINLSAGTFGVFLISDILLGIALSLISGSDVALAYDSFKLLGKTDRFAAFERRQQSNAGWSEAIGGIIGAASAAINLRYPFVIQFVLVAIFVINALRLTEAPAAEQHVKPTWSGLRDTIREIVLERPSARSLIYFSAVSSTGTFLIIWFAQASMSAAGIPTLYFGLMWALFHGAMAVASSYSGIAEDRMGTRTTFWILALAIPLAFLTLGIASPVFGLAGVLLLYIVRGVRTPVIRIHLNALVPSSSRATAQSINSFAFRVLFASLSPVMGMIEKSSGLATAYVAAAAFFAVLGVHAAFGLTRREPFSRS